jgi:hypothetical protein
MKKILMYCGVLATIMILENSGSSFLFFQERTYFFLFSLLAVWVVEKGFLSALPIIFCTLILFEGMTQSAIGVLSLYGVLFAYGISFLLKRLHLEYGGERAFLSLVVGIGMAGYPIFFLGYDSGVMAIFHGGLFGREFFVNIVIGSLIFFSILSTKDYLNVNTLSRRTLS